MSVFDLLGAALERGAQAIEPLFGTAATAAAIILLTLGVRAALHPLARAAARGEKARAALAPQLAALQRKHRGDRERLQRATADLYADSGSSPLAGCLPTLLQLPVFFVMYHLFSTGNGTLLDHTLLGAPLGGSWRQALADGGVAGPHGLVYLALFALIAAVATWNYRRARAAVGAAPTPAAGTAVPGMGTVNKLMPLLSFGTLITVAVVPLAAALYVVTSTTWTACERALLHRDRRPASAPEPAAQTAPRPRPQERSEPAPRPARRSGPQTRAARQQAARARANAAARAGASDRPADPDHRAAGTDPIVITPQ
ncbi:membrane protein insertase YidC [Streptomyces noursei]|uniref:membrane protein insertase YidC n=1 Tax=Streptomyces noursei TaxID=1971 RepID=UPI0033325878